MAQVDHQDYMAWETQGPIPDRSVERLATTDRGVILFRQVLRENIERVQQGGDPLGVMRDPDHPMIDTNLTGSLHVELGWLPKTKDEAPAFGRSTALPRAQVGSVQGAPRSSTRAGRARG